MLQETYLKKLNKLPGTSGVVFLCQNRYIELLKLIRLVPVFI